MPRPKKEEGGKVSTQNESGLAALRNGVREINKQLEQLHKVAELTTAAIVELTADVNDLKARIQPLEGKKAQWKDIQRVEGFNGEQAPEPESNSMLRMGREDKLQSMINACRVLPPNYKIDGRHSAKNVQALCGFVVTDEMLDDVYAVIGEDT